MSCICKEIWERGATTYDGTPRIERDLCCVEHGIHTTLSRLRVLCEDARVGERQRLGSSREDIHTRQAEFAKQMTPERVLALVELAELTTKYQARCHDAYCAKMRNAVYSSSECTCGRDALDDRVHEIYRNL